MKEFFTNVSSLSWWISVVIVGILINLFSAYFKIKLDSYLSNVSSWWRKRSEAQKAESLKHLESIRGNFNEHIMWALDEFRLRVMSTQYMVLSVVAFGIATLFDRLTASDPDKKVLLVTIIKQALFVFGTLILFGGLMAHQTAGSIRRLLTEARKSGESKD